VGLQTQRISIIKKGKLMTNPDYFKKVLEEQIGGNHYKDRFEIEPAEFILKK
jgi:hypothetical protein